MPLIRTRRRAFTLTEMLIVIGLLVVLVGILLPALGGVWSTGEMTRSMNNMRQVATWMGQYSSENNDFILPSRFNYGENPYPGKVRSNPAPPIGYPASGTWTDILHAVYEVGLYPDAAVALQNDYRYDSPDWALYHLVGQEQVKNPFRSGADNTRMWNPGDFDPTRPEPPKPFGKGAQEQGLPGFFAANDFFKAGWTNADDDGRFFTNGQIRYPDQSLYLIDSYMGEIIDDAPVRFISADEDDDGKPDWEVDFRYLGDTVLLTLLMDGHVDTQTQWEDLPDLESRHVRVCNLDQRRAVCPER